MVFYNRYYLQLIVWRVYICYQYSEIYLHERKSTLRELIIVKLIRV